jgi:hypothetical protein
MKKLVAIALMAVPLTFAAPGHDSQPPADQTSTPKTKKHNKKHNKKDKADTGTSAPESK